MAEARATPKQPQTNRTMGIWPWVVGAVLVLIGIAVLVFGVTVNAGDDDPPSTQPVSFSTITSTTAPRVEAGMSREECRAYVTDLERLARVGAAFVGEAGETAIFAGQGGTSFDRARVVFLGTAERLVILNEEISDLGNPPTHLTDAVAMLQRAFANIELALEEAADAIAREDADRLQGAISRSENASEVLDRATSSIRPC